MMCKAIMRLTKGVEGGNGAVYAHDLARLAYFTTRSAISLEMRELVGKALDGDGLFVRPSPVLASLFPKWDKISDFIRAGGVGQLEFAGHVYNMDDFRLLISLINCGALRDDVVGDDVVGSAEISERAQVDNPKMLQSGIFVPGSYSLAGALSDDLKVWNLPQRVLDL